MDDDLKNKKKIIEFLLDNDFIVEEDFLENLNSLNFYEFCNFVIKKTKGDPVYDLVLDMLKNLGHSDNNPVEVLFNYNNKPDKIVVNDFVSYFTARYNSLKSLIVGRQGLESPVSIRRLSKGKESVAIVGLVYDKTITKNDNIILTVEDPTGMIKVLISKNKESLYNLGKNVVLDQLIGVVGNMGDNIIFANKLYEPDLPFGTEFKKAPDESYAIFIGDTHFGSKMFYHKEFARFIEWINGRIGTPEQKKISKKIGYLFIVGDLVEGVGIYPNQENDLEVEDIYEQYALFIKHIKKIPKRIKIIISPGNHDAMRLSEPQPPLLKEYTKELWDMENVIMVSNPAIVNIHKKNNFPGFNVLMYHGFSFPYYADVVEEIRSQGGLKKPDMIMKFLLQKRHLSPTHTSNLYLPDKTKDNLVIEKIPDFFITGHIHRVSSSDYKNVTMINCSSWLAETEYQVKVGLRPQPARVPIINLQTREVKIMNFL